MPLKDPVARLAYQKSPQEKERQKQSHLKHRTQPNYIKRRHIRNWSEKMIFWDVEEIYERYITSTHCEICHIEYTGYRSSHTKNLDHCYLCKYPRFVCCHKCNHHLQKVDNQRYKMLLEIHRVTNVKLV